MTSNRVASPPEATSSGAHSGESLLRPEDHVLSTLEADGSRRWLFPRLAPGYFWTRRRVMAYALVAIFTLIPHIYLNGKPLILLHLAKRQFTLFGYTFLPTDTLLLALVMVTVFLSIFWITAIFGRVWCGWGCPQTVYMEFFFRPIDRLFQGSAGKGGKPTKPITGIRYALRFLVYLLLCAFLAHTFLAYFVGVAELRQWVQHSPFEHPIPFLVMAATTGLMLFDFLYFREQTCLIACPYGRFQSVMLDRRSLIVSYDRLRGEPRGKGKRTASNSHENTEKTATLPVVQADSAKGAESAKGDCVDCGMCVQVCPTGIDIRNGLQLECIHCAQCIDACDSVMTKLHLPTGLVRYGNQDAIERKPSGMLRPRIFVYPVVMSIVISAFLYLFLNKKEFDVSIYRNFGNSYSIGQDDWIDNTLKLSVTNRSNETRTYQVSMLQPSEARVRCIDGETITLKPLEQRFVPVLVSSPFKNFDSSRCPAILKVVDSGGEEDTEEYVLLGPYQIPKTEPITEPVLSSAGESQ